MSKICNKDNCSNPVFSKGYCKWHQYLRPIKKPSTKVQHYIKPFSVKKINELAEYRVVRDKYKEKNPKCEICGHNKIEVHHIYSRLGKALSDPETFMSVCRRCHCWIHEHPKESKKLGYLASEEDKKKYLDKNHYI